MSSTIQVGASEFIPAEICERLGKSTLLPQMLRELIIDEVLADWEIDLDGKIPYSRDEFAQGCDNLGKLAEHQGLNHLQLYKVVDRHLRLRKFKHTRWNSQVYSYYLRNKSRFDRVEFSLIGTTSLTLTEEILFRVQGGEQALSDLAVKYSECEAASDGGKISSSDIYRSHPGISPHLVNLRAGQLSPIFTLGHLYVFIRLEGYISAELDDRLNSTLINELFETWIQERVTSRLSVFELVKDQDILTPIATQQDLVVNPEFLELISVIDRQAAIDTSTHRHQAQIEPAESSELIEPTVSFFFPKEVPSHGDPTDVGVSSSFFFPTEMPATIVRPPIPLGKVEKTLAFLTFFAIFLGLQILAMDLVRRSNYPQFDPGSSQIRNN